MEYALINPRHRRHRRKRARARRRTTTRRRRRRVNGLYAANPRPRRRSHRRHHRRISRRRHNPRFSGGGTLMTRAKQGLTGVAGFAITNIAVAGFLNNVPGIPANFKTGLPRTAVKAVVGGIALPFILKKTPLKGFANAVAVGAWIAVGIDLYNAYVEGNLPASLKDYGEEFGSSLHDYQTGQLMDYQTGSLMDDESRGGEQLSGSIYEGGPYE